MRLTGKRIATLVAEDVEDLEFYVPFMRLQEEGAEVIAAGLDLKPVHGKNGLEITSTAKIDSLNSKDLFALVIPGGKRERGRQRVLRVPPEEPRRHLDSVDVPGGDVGVTSEGGQDHAEFVFMLVTESERSADRNHPPCPPADRSPRP